MNTQSNHTGGNHDQATEQADDAAHRIRPLAPGPTPRIASDDATADEAPPRKQRTRLIVISAALLVLAIGAAVYYVIDVLPYESTDDAYIEGHVVAISPQVAAHAAAVHVDDNQYVHKGDLLVELDPTDYDVALRQAQGAEAAAKGRLQQARASVGVAESAIVQARATVESSQATLENAEADLKRYQGLSPEARSQQDLDKAIAVRKTATAGVEQARAQLQSAQSQLTSAQANVVAAEGDDQKAQADTERARVNLNYCRITAPDDGRITNKTVERGAYVTPASTLFQIVPPQVWIVANFKETQLDHMRPGQPVRVSVDAYPDVALSGTVDSLQAGTGSRFSIIPAENATGNFVKVVQRLPVKIRVTTDNASAQLLAPGMSVEPSVRIR